MTTQKSHKRRGAGYEIDIRDWFRTRGYDAERLARAGSLDEGDIVVRKDFIGGTIGILECKAPGESGKINLAGWTREAQVEAANYARARGIDEDAILPAVLIKARGKSISDSYLVLRLGDVFND